MKTPFQGMDARAIAEAIVATVRMDSNDENCVEYIIEALIEAASRGYYGAGLD